MRKDKNFLPIHLSALNRELFDNRIYSTPMTSPLLSAKPASHMIKRTPKCVDYSDGTAQSVTKAITGRGIKGTCVQS